MKIKAIICSLILFCITQHSAGAETLFVFNPEARVSELEKVKVGFEKYLKAGSGHAIAKGHFWQ